MGITSVLLTDTGILLLSRENVSCLRWLFVDKEKLASNSCLVTNKLHKETKLWERDTMILFIPGSLCDPYFLQVMWLKSWMKIVESKDVLRIKRFLLKNFLQPKTILIASYLKCSASRHVKTAMPFSPALCLDRPPATPPPPPPCWCQLVLHPYLMYGFGKIPQQTGCCSDWLPEPCLWSRTLLNVKHIM